MRTLDAVYSARVNEAASRLSLGYDNELWGREYAQGLKLARVTAELGALEGL